MAASATFALKAGVWFRRGRRCMVSPDSQATSVPAVRQKFHLSSCPKFRDQLWPLALDESHIILCNLSGGGLVYEAGADLVGRLLVRFMLFHAKRRKKPHLL